MKHHWVNAKTRGDHECAACGAWAAGYKLRKELSTAGCPGRACESCKRPIWLPAESDQDMEITWPADSVPGSWFEHQDGGDHYGCLECLNESLEKSNAMRGRDGSIKPTFQPIPLKENAND